MSARARQIAGVKGLSRLRRLLRKPINDSIRREVAIAIEAGAVETEEVERFMAPRRDGDLVTSITHVISSDGLSAVIGPGIRGATTIKKRSGSYFGTQRVSARSGKALNFSKQTQFDRFQLMKAYWLEVGTKKMGRHPFVEPTFDAVKGKVFKRISKAVDLGLSKILKG